MAKLTISLQLNPALLALLREGRGQEGGPYRRAARRGLTLAADAWYRGYLPLHFTPAAPGRYPGAYTPRSRGYAIRKARRGAAGRPMVWTGTHRDTVTRPGAATVKAPPSLANRSIAVTLTLPYSRVVNLWTGTRASRAGYRHDFRRELTEIRADEADALRQIVEREVQDGINNELDAGEKALVTIELGGRGARAAQERFFGVFGGAGGFRGRVNVNSLFGHTSVQGVLEAG